MHANAKVSYGPNELAGVPRRLVLHSSLEAISKNFFEMVSITMTGQSH